MVRDKFGDERKYSDEALRALIHKQGLSLVREDKWEKALDEVLMVLNPFLGPGALSLAAPIRKFLSRLIAK